MSKSIVQTGEKECYLCRIIEDINNVVNLEQHHIFHGTANRQQADKFGCWCWLCQHHHRTGEDAVHRDAAIDLGLKKIAQLRFEQIHGHDKFMQVFGKSYL